MLEDIQGQIAQLKRDFNDKFDTISTAEELEAQRIAYLGKKGAITGLLKSLGKLPIETRPQAGQLINELKNFAEKRLEDFRDILAEKQIENSIRNEGIDVTLPGNRRPLGRLHPLTLVLDEMIEMFIGMGFSVADGPEVETDYYNFEALNIPKNHPVKDEQDTFYTSDGFLLRTQTSGVQIRTMEKSAPPIRIIAPGKVYRSDEWDATHGPTFHQIEGLLVDEGVTMADLKGILTVFAQNILGNDIEIRFRPSFFPFTEPSAEMDVQCFACGGKDSVCPVCKATGWVELLGCGMVHSNVLKNCNIDPSKYSGYAFGMGIDRIVMQRYAINDLRLLYENDMHFLQSF